MTANHSLTYRWYFITFFLFIQRIILYLKKFISKSPITSVSATTDSFLGVASMTIDSMPEPVDPLYLDRLLSKVVYLQKQIKLLDKERDALNNFYRNGERERESNGFFFISISLQMSNLQILDYKINIRSIWIQNSQ